MTDPTIAADAAQRRLVEAVVRIASNKLTVADMAVNAFVQNIVTQAALQALLMHIKAKNLISRAELDRVLAKAYDEATAEANTHGLIAVPTHQATVTR